MFEREIEEYERVPREYQANVTEKMGQKKRNALPMLFF